MKVIKEVFMFLAILAISGCGYSTKGFTFKENKIIIVPVVNTIDITSEKRQYLRYETFPRLIENKLTNELIAKFNIEGHLKVVNEFPEALKLICSVNQYSKEALSFEDDDSPDEQRLRLHVRTQLYSSEGKLLINQTIVGETTYFLSGANQKTEAAAQEDLIDDTARRISEAVLESW